MDTAALAFRLVHRDVGVDDHLVGDSIAGPGVGDPDAGRDGQRRAGQDERGAERVLDAGSQDLDVVGVGQVLAEEDEFVAGDPGQRVAGADHRGQPLRDGDQQLVADGMPVGVVDPLETVEVDEQHRRGAVGPLGPSSRMLQPLLEQQPIRKPGHRIVQGDVPEPAGDLRHPLPRLGVQQVGRRDVGQRLCRRHISGFQPPLGLTVKVQRAEAAVTVQQRKGEHRRHARGHRRRAELRVAAVDREVGHLDRLTRLVRGPARPFPVIGLQLH